MPLPVGHFGSIGQQRDDRLGHALGSAGEAESALLAAECHEPLGVALLAAHAQEVFLQPPALQASLELLLNVLWQRSANLGAQLMKFGIVPLDELIQQRGFGSVPGAAGRVEEWRRRTWRASRQWAGTHGRAVLAAR